MNRYRVTNNWFENMMNEIHHNTTSNAYKVVVSDLNDKKVNALKSDPSKTNDKNNYVTMNKESVKATNKAAEEEAAKAFDSKKDEINDGFFSGIVKAVKAVWNWFTSWW